MKELLLASSNTSVVPPSTNDPFFAYNSLLVHGSGTNGGNNDTFLDSSTNHFSITRSGTTTQGPFTPYGSYWSGLFNGTTDYLQTAGITFSGDFTIEAWIKSSAITGNIIVGWTSTSIATQCAYLINLNAGVLNAHFGQGSNNSLIVTGTLPITLNQWTHIAVTRSGSTVRLFVNGVLDSATLTMSGGLNAAPDTKIGFVTTGVHFSGLISDVRVVKGTALYTATFAPPTDTLTAVSGTVLLTCQSNRFKDNSTNNSTITFIGTPATTRSSPYGSGVSGYTKSAIGGSFWNLIKTDSLKGPNATQLVTLSGDFTYETWMYPTDNTLTAIEFFETRSSNTVQPWLIAVNQYSANSGWQVQFYNGVTAFFSTQRVPPYQWSHVAIVRTGSTVSFFVNGQLDPSTATVSGTLTGTAAGGVWLGNGTDSGIAGYGGTAYFTDMRLINGTALYSTSFTPAIAPIGTVTNTALLLNASNYGIIDSTGKNDLSTSTGVTISNTQSKFGGGALQFNGTNYIELPTNTFDFQFPGAFTMEAWIYPTTNVTEIFSTNQAGPQQWEFFVTTARNMGLAFYYGTHGSTETERYTGIFPPLNTWSHVAVCRDANNVWYFYLNGSLLPTQIYQSGQSWSDSQSFSTLGIFPTIGSNMVGFMNEIRITKDIARYTAAFAPPTNPFADHK